MEKESQFVKMTTQPVERLIPALALPMIVSMLVSAIYNTADTFFVSQINTSASGAVGVVFSVMSIMQALGFLFGMGAGSNISRLLGQKDTEKASEIAASAFVITFILGVIIAVLGMVFNRQIVSILGATPTILPYAQSYSMYIFIGTPFICTSFVLNNIMRSQGRAFFSMVGLSFGGVLNIILDPIFIFVFDLGIGGAAIATLISQFISFLILLFFCVRKKGNMVSLNIKNAVLKLSVYIDIIKMGLPSFFRQGLASIANIMLNLGAMAYGDAAVSAMSIVGRTSFIMTAVLLGFGQGFQPVAGFAYGAQKYGRVRKAFKFTLLTGMIMLFVLSVVCFVFADEIIVLFRKSDPDVIEIGTLALKLQCATMFIQPLSIISNMLLQSVGLPVEATLTSISRQGLFFIPAVIILPMFWGLLGVQASQPVSDLLAAVFCVFFLKKFFSQLPKDDIEVLKN